MIRSLKDEYGVSHATSSAIQSLIQDYFRRIFTSTTPNPGVIDEYLTCLTSKVSAAANAELIRPHTADKVQRVLNQMHPLKSPGPSGMSPCFFQKFWNIVRRDTTSCVLNILNKGPFTLSLMLLTLFCCLNVPAQRRF
ncbi:UNVERIFIED_CONTAM: hypothetical protein Slati_0125000 [Sesamum latifolium]|uniref:Reverse transcriptase n=1 Tax=Sesamum latifolium TaxID=2727402 RepID=A0AAW2Y9H8_9LAMI